MYKDPHLTLPNTPDAEGKRNWCYGPNAKLLTPVKPSSYKCPPGWVQNNYVIGDTSTGYSSDPDNGFCTNPYLEPFYAKSQTAFVPLMVNFYGTMYPMCQVGEQKSIARFAYGPLYNQYPNNANIPDATPITNTKQPVITVAPEQWFFPNPPPANWAELSLPDSSEANIPTTYTCPEGWTQNKDATDLSSGTCTSVGRYEPPSKMPNSVPNKSKFNLDSGYNYMNGPLYTIYYGPKYKKWPNNNNIPSLSELLALPPSDYQPIRFNYGASLAEQGVIVTPPSSFYYKERPSYWPSLNPLDQTKTPPTIIYTQNPTIPPPIGNPMLPPYVTPVTPRPVAPSVVPSIVTSVAPSIVTSVAPSIVTSVAPSSVVQSIVTPVVPSPVVPSIVTPVAPRSPSSSKGPSPAPAKTIIDGIPNEYLFGGIAIFVIFILLIVIII